MRTYSEDIVKGTLYGLAIGDAMGATTEYYSQSSIKQMYKKRTDIIGKGWLNLYPGEVTDPTEIAFCMCEALEKTHHYRGQNNFRKKLLNQFCQNLTKWYAAHPVDIEDCCRQVIVKCKGLDYTEGIQVSEDPANVSNSNLFRCIPMMLLRLKRDFMIEQSRITHNSPICDKGIIRFHEMMRACLKNEQLTTHVFPQLPERYRHIDCTLDSTLYHLETTATFEGAVMEAVYHGGDTDAIAALTGSLAGAMHGYHSIPERWISQLRPEVKEKLDYYSDFLSSLHNSSIAS